MDNTTQQPTDKFQNAIALLENNMAKRQKALPASLRKSLILILNTNTGLLNIKGNKIIIPTQFYTLWTHKHKLDKETEQMDSSHYIFFRKLRKYGYIHTKSSYFPKKLAVISLNPTMPSLYKGNMKDITRYIKAKRSLYPDKLRTLDLSQTTKLAYIDLKLFQNIKLGESEIKRINTDDIIFINQSTAYIYLEERGIFDNMSIQPYQLILIEGKKLIKVFKKLLKNKIIFPFEDSKYDSKTLTYYRVEHLAGMSMQCIKMSAQNSIIMKSISLMATIATSRKAMSQVTISELQHLYPSSVPSHLIKMEGNRILNALSRTKELDNEEDFINASFSLEEFDYFEELLKTRSKTAFMKKIEPTKRELNIYANSIEAEPHGILITKYIIYLLSSVDKENKDRKIAISTFRNYYSLVKKHLFENIEDLSNVQTDEISEILQNLAINKYADKSISKVKSLISDFFTFSRQKYNTIHMNLSTYPKSLVFESEIDTILHRVDKQHIEESAKDNEYKTLRDKAIILMARYTGLRKSELRSRLMQDIYIYEDELFVDVNKEGLKKLDLTLKTHSAERRVCTKIKNLAHLRIITQYIELRVKMKTKNKFFFLQSKIEKPKVVQESIFSNLTKIIQDATGRYTSFHSLRHTFATYAVMEILQSKEVNPYKMIDLAVKMGHTSPEITLKKYTHRSVIESLSTNKDKK